VSNTPPVVTASPAAILQYGGQAVIEGVMMRSARYFAVACRKPDGSIIVQREDVDKSIMGKLKWLNWPFGRGTLALIDAMALGIKALGFAGSVQMGTENPVLLDSGRDADPRVPTLNSDRSRTDTELLPASEPGRSAPQQPDVVRPAASAADPPAGVQAAASPLKMPSSGKINDIAINGTIVFSLAFGIGLFVLLPTAITGLLTRLNLVGHSGGHRDMRLNIADGIIRMVIFFAYIGLISQMPNIKRVFMYHGAEHKAINTLEAGLSLSPENALQSSRIHPRCGTSFIFIVLLINIIVFAFLPRPAFLPFRFLEHLAVIPLVAGIAYEVIKAAGKHRHNKLVMAVFAPGMATQYLTTREPDAGQIEVALAALLSVLEAEGHLAPDPLPFS